MRIFFITCSLIISISALGQTLDDSLWICLPFNNNGLDQSGNGNNASVTNSTYVSDRFGQPNRAIRIHRSSDYFTLPGSAFSGFYTSPYAFSFWIKPDTVYPCSGPKPYIFGHLDTLEYIAPIYGYSFGRFCTGNIRFIAEDNPGNADVWIDATHSFKSKTWHHVVVNRTATDYEMYLDGQFAKSVATTSVIPEPTEDFVFGKRSLENTISDDYTGAADDFRVYRRSLTASEIDSLYQMEKGGCCDEEAYRSSNFKDPCAPVENPESVEQIEENRIDFAVYPNPLRLGSVRLQTDELQGHVTIIDCKGAVVKQSSWTSQQTIDLEDLENGLYSVRFQTKSSVGFQTLMIQR